MKAILHIITFALLTIPFCFADDAEQKPIDPRVEIEEEVYTYEPADNGAGPMWCHGNTSIVRMGDEVYASGLETIPGAKPLNNCLPLLFRRTDEGWKQIYKGEGRTREPSPMTMFHDGRVFQSINPTLSKPEEYDGLAKPQILVFSHSSEQYKTLTPIWEGTPSFSGHSYRSFVADGADGELILFQNIGYAHAEWSFLDKKGNWSAQGKIKWPFEEKYDKPQPVRICYPNVMLKDRAVHFCGVSDIVEPYQVWQEFKFELTGRKWDYDFRRLFYTWSDDITKEGFHEWVEIASRDKTCGWISPRDLHVLDSGDVLILWSERALDERLREKFFPNEKQRYSLEFAVIRKGKVILRKTLIEGGEDLGGARPGDACFHVLEDGRLFIFYYLSGTDAEGKSIAGNRLMEISPDGKTGKSIPVKLQTPFGSFFTATIRAGCKPSSIIDVFGSSNQTMRYARIRLY